VLRPVGHPDVFKRLRYAALPICNGNPAVSERQLHIFVDREVTDQIKGLEDESDLAITDPRPIRGGQ
jgi:hypothetical protein